MKTLLLNRRAGRTDLAVLLFGNGTIGSAVATALARQAGQAMARVDYAWTDAASRSAARDTITASIAAAERATEVAIVWTAGRSGMGSTLDAVTDEVSLVAELVDFAARLAPQSAGVHFHLMSSAGGLFEGQTFVDDATVPLASRPYGTGKLRQEDLLRAAAAQNDGIAYTVYRASSVYGFAAQGRLGLIPTILTNGVRRGVTRIVGRRDTLRDYVYNEDIGRFVADRVLRGAGVSGGEVILASGKSTLIGEIVAEAEALLDTRVYLQFEPNPSNAEPMSFRPSALPRDFVVTDLRTGLRRVALTLQTHLSGQ